MHVPMLLRVRMGRHCRVVLCWALLCKVLCGVRLGTGGFLKGDVLAALLQVGRRLAGD